MTRHYTTFIFSFLLALIGTGFIHSAQAQRRCRQAMPQHQFQKKRNKIQNQRGPQRLQVAQRVARNNCLNSNQVKKIAQIFRKDQNRLAFAKTAFHNTVDRRNFNRVYSTFYNQQFRQRLKRYVRNKGGGNYGGGGGHGHDNDKKWCKCGSHYGHCGSCKSDKKWCKCGKRYRHKDHCKGGNGGGSVGYGGQGGKRLISHQGYTNVLQRIQNENFSTKRLNTAKNIFRTKNRAFTTSQIRTIAKNFTFRGDKMDFLKFAYNYANNKRNYSNLSSVFTFSSDREAFLRYVRSKQGK